MTSFPSFHSSGLRRGCLWLLQQTMGTTYRPFRCSSRRTRWAVKLYRNTHVRICWTIKPLRSVFLVISLRPSFQTHHHCYSSCVTHTSTTSCFFFSFRPCRRRSRDTSHAAMTSSSAAIASWRRTPRAWRLSEHVSLSYRTSGTSSSRRQRSGTSGWRRPIRRSSTTSTRPRRRPGWANRSFTWCQRRKLRCVQFEATAGSVK